MTLATKQDIEKRKKKLDTWLRGLNEDGSMSEKKLCTLLRSSVRNVWLRHPVKLSYIYSKSYPDKNPTTRTKWLIDCEMCTRSFKMSAIQVDHMKGEHQLLSLDDVVPFATSILGVSHEDLQILCVPCHEAKTYSSRYNVTLEEAFAEKEVIAKLKQPVTKQKSELKLAGFKHKEITNAVKRRGCYRTLLQKEN